MIIYAFCTCFLRKNILPEVYVKYLISQFSIIILVFPDPWENLSTTNRKQVNTIRRLLFSPSKQNFLLSIIMDFSSRKRGSLFRFIQPTSTNEIHIDIQCREGGNTSPNERIDKFIINIP